MLALGLNIVVGFAGRAIPQADHDAAQVFATAVGLSFTYAPETRAPEASAIRTTLTLSFSTTIFLLCLPTRPTFAPMTACSSPRVNPASVASFASRRATISPWPR